MKILYITDMNPLNKGGLFKATYERILRHSVHNDVYIINNNYYDSNIIRLLKDKITNKKSEKLLSNKYTVGDLEIENLNFKNNLTAYVKRKIKLEICFNRDVVEFYVKKYHPILSSVDIIHAHWGFPQGYLAYKLSQQYKKPYFITFHGSDINKIKETDAVLMVEAMEKAEKCFFVSQQLLEDAKKTGYSGLNAEVTYNGVDIKQFNIPKRKVRKNPVVGYVGALEEIKGADLLPEIFHHIYVKANEKVEFVIVGEGSLRGKLQRELEASGMTVHLKGYIDFNQIPNILESFDALVVPSRNEGLGMVILEANAMGIATIGTKIGGIPEAIGYQENLIEMNQEFTEKMAERVVEIIEGKQGNPKKYRNRIIDKFQWEETIKLEETRYLDSLIGNQKKIY